MKIKTTVTEIECNAEELRQSNSVADAVLGVIRRCFNGELPDDEEQEDGKED